MLPIVSNLPLAGILYALNQSSWSGWLIVALLFIGSILAWSVLLSKYNELNQADRGNGRFVKAYRAGGHPMALFLKRERHEVSPLFQVYQDACRAVATALEDQGDAAPALVAGGLRRGSVSLEPHRLAGIRSAAERVMGDRVLFLESRMGFLAIASTTAPFLGLLGTVWGVMDAFGGMAVTGNAQLSAVAPGISSALLTTVIGLIVALPSTIGYNLLQDRIRRMTVELDNFLQEVTADIERFYYRPKQDQHHGATGTQEFIEAD